MPKMLSDRKWYRSGRFILLLLLMYFWRWSWLMFSIHIVCYLILLREWSWLRLQVMYIVQQNSLSFHKLFALVFFHLLQTDESILNQLLCDIQQFIHVYGPEHSLTGRAIARIFHGIDSPRFPATTWGRVRRFWRAYLNVDFNLVLREASKLLLTMRWWWHSVISHYAFIFLVLFTHDTFIWLKFLRMTWLYAVVFV